VFLSAKSITKILFLDILWNLLYILLITVISKLNDFGCFFLNLSSIEKNFNKTPILTTVITLLFTIKTK